MNRCLKNTLKNGSRRFRTWILDSRPLEPVLGRQFHVEPEFQIENDGFQAPDGKNNKMLSLEHYCLVRWCLNMLYLGGRTKHLTPKHLIFYS